MHQIRSEEIPNLDLTKTLNYLAAGVGRITLNPLIGREGRPVLFYNLHRSRSCVCNISFTVQFPCESGRVFSICIKINVL